MDSSAVCGMDVRETKATIERMREVRAQQKRMGVMGESHSPQRIEIGGRNMLYITKSNASGMVG